MFCDDCDDGDGVVFRMHGSVGVELEVRSGQDAEARCEEDMRST